MPASLLASQLATLEPLRSDEPGVRLDISHTPEDLARTVATAVGGHTELR